MTERERIRRLDQENAHLFDRLRCKERECLELIEANVNLRIERDATDVLLGEAMDAALEGRRQ